MHVIMPNEGLKWNGTAANDEIQVSAIGLTYYWNLWFLTILLLNPIADEAASTGVDVRYGGATITVTGLEAGHGSGNIDKTHTMPQDSPLPRVNTLGSDEGSMTLQELMVLCSTLSKKGRKIATIDQDPAISLVQHDAEIQERHEHDMEFDFDLDAAKDVNTAEKDLRGYSFDEIKNLFETTMRRVHTFVPIESEIERAKDCESSKLAKEPRDKEGDELSQEELQQMMIIVPEQGMNVEALQTKYPIIDWVIYTEGTKIIRVGNHTEVHQFFNDMLKALDMDDLVMLWSLVKERFNSTEPTDDKEREIWVELKRLFEPDTDDELWKLQKHIHDLTWKLYDSCGVHHVSTEKGIDIYMLVEKEYPLSRGTLTQMLVAKLLVEQDKMRFLSITSKGGR
ncbi:hypothetical protein Tco_1338162 [Tanacetum coccineum]